MKTIWVGMFAACVALSACGPSTTDTVVHDAVVASNTTASIIDSLQTSALVMYRFEQELALNTAIQRGESKAEATARVLVVRNQWAQIWEAFGRARLAHETLASLIATGSASVDAIKGAQDGVETRLTQVRALLGEARARVEVQ